MAHPDQRQFFESVKATHPQAFQGVVALDCGSLDVNGSLKDLFDAESSYVGVDIRPGAGVDVRAFIHELPWPEGAFDTIVSAEMLEHDEYWNLSLIKMYQLLRVGGLLALSMATTGRAEHGTRRYPDTGTCGDGIWGTSQTYYRNLTLEDLEGVFVVDRQFSMWCAETNQRHCDLYFWGIKA